MIKKNIFVLLIIIFCFRNSPAQIKIGVLLPMMSSSEIAEEKKPGEFILKGVRDALDEYNASNLSNKAEIILEDTKREPAAALESINKLASNKDVVAIFGPVYSSELAKNAGAADFHKIPIITPTATLNFLASNNPYVFQLNPTYEIRGKLLAKFAIEKLGMKNFYVLSEESYGKYYSEGFLNEVKSRGNDSLMVQYYPQETKDFSSYFESIRAKILSEDKFIDFGNLDKASIEKLAKVKFQFSNIDSLVNNKLAVSIMKLFGKDANTIINELKIIPANISDPAKKIIPGIADAIYIPVSNSGEITELLNAFTQSGIILPVLGMSDWNNPNLLEENKSKINRLYFESDFYLNDEKKNSKTDFLNDTDLKNYYFGFDGMKLILDEIHSGKRTREELNDALENMKDYKAFHNKVTIKERTNNCLSIMSFTGGELIKISDYTY